MFCPCSYKHRFAFPSVLLHQREYCLNEVRFVRFVLFVLSTQTEVVHWFCRVCCYDRCAEVESTPYHLPNLFRTHILRGLAMSQNSEHAFLVVVGCSSSALILQRWSPMDLLQTTIGVNPSPVTISHATMFRKWWMTLYWFHASSSAGSLLNYLSGNVWFICFFHVNFLLISCWTDLVFYETNHRCRNL